MDEILGVLAAILMGVVGITYSYSIIKGRIKPVLTTWFLFSVTVGLSLLSYFFTKTPTVIGNIINVADVVMCWSILIVLILKNKSASLRFTKFEIFCLYLSGIIVIFWIFSREHAAANILLQLILTIAYLPTFVRLWNTTTNTESLFIWGINWTATLSGMIASFLRNDFLGSLYGLRALTLITILIVLILRLKYKEPAISRAI